MGESYAMTGDVKKAPQVQEKMIQDMQCLQEQLGMVPGASSPDEPGDPPPEVVAAQKQCKLQVRLRGRSAKSSNNYDAFSLFESHLNQFPDARIRLLSFKKQQNISLTFRFFDGEW